MRQHLTLIFYAPVGIWSWAQWQSCGVNGVEAIAQGGTDRDGLTYALFNLMLASDAGLGPEYPMALRTVHRLCDYEAFVEKDLILLV